MAWQPLEALRNIRALKRFDVDCIEQPIAAGNLSDLAMLVRETDAEIIVDEGFTDRLSLARLVQWQACRGVSVRISKCGGLIAAARRCEEAQRAGLHLQIGCHVGESSLLSAAQRILLAGVGPPKYVEGAYGRHLLREDPIVPNLQLGYGGRAPELPAGPGLGVEVDEAKLERWVGRRACVVNGTRETLKKGDAYVVCS
jgi:muconate cycloisomerase